MTEKEEKEFFIQTYYIFVQDYKKPLHKVFVLELFRHYVRMETEARALAVGVDLSTLFGLPEEIANGTQDFYEFLSALLLFNLSGFYDETTEYQRPYHRLLLRSFLAYTIDFIRDQNVKGTPRYTTETLDEFIKEYATLLEVLPEFDLEGVEGRGRWSVIMKELQFWPLGFEVVEIPDNYIEDLSQLFIKYELMFDEDDCDDFFTPATYDMFGKYVCLLRYVSANNSMFVIQDIIVEQVLDHISLGWREYGSKARVETMSVLRDAFLKIRDLSDKPQAAKESIRTVLRRIQSYANATWELPVIKPSVESEPSLPLQEYPPQEITFTPVEDKSSQSSNVSVRKEYQLHLNEKHEIPEEVLPLSIDVFSPSVVSQMFLTQEMPVGELLIEYFKMFYIEVDLTDLDQVRLFPDIGFHFINKFDTKEAMASPTYWKMARNYPLAIYGDVQREMETKLSVHPPCVEALKTSFMPALRKFANQAILDNEVLRCNKEPAKKEFIYEALKALRKSPFVAGITNVLMGGSAIAMNYKETEEDQTTTGVQSEKNYMYSLRNNAHFQSRYKYDVVNNIQYLANNTHVSNCYRVQKREGMNIEAHHTHSQYYRSILAMVPLPLQHLHPDIPEIIHAIIKGLPLACFLLFSPYNEASWWKENLPLLEEYFNAMIATHIDLIMDHLDSVPFFVRHVEYRKLQVKKDIPVRLPDVAQTVALVGDYGSGRRQLMRLLTGAETIQFFDAASPVDMQYIDHKDRFLFPVSIDPNAFVMQNNRIIVSPGALHILTISPLIVIVINSHDQYSRRYALQQLFYLDEHNLLSKTVILVLELVPMQRRVSELWKQTLILKNKIEELAGDQYDFMFDRIFNFNMSSMYNSSEARAASALEGKDLLITMLETIEK